MAKMRMTGVVLYAADGLRLVPIDAEGNAAGQRLKRVEISPVAAVDLGLEPGQIGQFVADIRLRPRTTLHATFDVVVGRVSTIIRASEVRFASESEVRAAIKVDLRQSLESLREADVKPVMSAEELTQIMRGDEEEVATLPSP